MPPSISRSIFIVIVCFLIRESVQQQNVRCTYAIDMGNCGTYETRYGWNEQAGTCTEFVYSGCGGNENNFPTMQECQRMCGGTGNGGQALPPCPNRQMPYGPCANGFCNGGYYCTDVNTCCPETSDRVTLFQSVTPQCPNGFNLNLRDGRFAACSIAIACGTGSQCMQTTNIPGMSVCCLTGGQPVNPVTPPPQPVCPTGAAPLLQGGQVVLCANNFNACPFGFTCQLGVYTTATNAVAPQLCCQSTTQPVNTAVCGAGRQPYIVSGQPQPCINGQANACPFGYSCTISNVNQQAYCCSGGGTVNPVNPVGSVTCPNGGTALSVNGVAMTCTRGVNGCPTGSTCSAVTGSNTPVCCTSNQPINPVNTAVCGTGRQPYVVNGQPQQCINGQANGCPFGYSCTIYSATQRAYCCSGGGTVNPVNPVGSVTCPNGGTSLSVNGVAMTCTVGGNRCPTGSTCSAVTGSNTPVCCASNQPINPVNPGVGGTGCPDRSASGPACSNDATCDLANGWMCVSGRCCASCRAREREARLYTRNGLTGPIPQCDRSGRYYLSQQCGADRVCICVSPYGQPIPNTQWYFGNPPANCDQMRLTFRP